MGDFNPVIGLDCGINLFSIVVLNYLSLVLGSVALLVFGVNLYLGLKDLTSLHVNSKLKFAISFFAQTILFTIYNIATIIDPETNIFGSNVWVTVVMAFAFMAMYFGLLFFFDAVMKLVKGMAKISSNDSHALVSASISTYKTRSMFLYCVATVGSLVCLVGLLVSNDHCYIVAKVWYFFWNIWHIAFLVCFNPPMNVIRHELKSFIDRQKARECHDVQTFEDIRYELVSCLFACLAAILDAFQG